MNIGETACRTYDDKYYTYKDSLTLKNGLVIKVMLPRKICRTIESIYNIKIPHTISIRKRKVDRACCDRAHADDIRLYGSNSFKMQCYHGDHSWECQKDYYIDSVYYTNAYQIKYSDSAIVDFEYSTIKTKIELNSNYYIEDNNIEIYRDDGTLKYKGELIYVPGDLENLPSYKTHGWCYNKLGTKEIRKTNNVGSCK